MDVNMPGGSGLSVCELLAADPAWSSIPVIVITGQADPQVMQRCHNLGAYYVPKCADVWQRVEPLVYEILESPAPESTASGEALLSNHPSTGDSTMKESPVENVFDESEHLVDSTPGVLVIDDEPAFADALRMRLQPYGVPVTCTDNGMGGYRTAFTHPIAAILLDFQMPNGRGDYVLRRLKENPGTSDIPVIVLTGRRDKSLERTMLNLGAASYLTKPVAFEDLFEELGQYLWPAGHPPVACPVGQV
jgi:CheY-like chemotaxis protein